MSRELFEIWFPPISYGVLWGTVILTVYLAFRALRPRRQLFSRENLTALALGFLITSAIALRWEGKFRILADESNLAGTATAMYQRAQNILPTEAIRSAGQWEWINMEIDPRPGMLPFLVHLLHRIAGHSPAHPFHVNYLASIVAIALLVKLGMAYFGWSTGILAAIALGLFPIYSATVRSAGFDTLNLACLLAMALQLRRFLRNPTIPNLEFGFALVLVAAQCRYETALAGIAFLGAALEKRRNFKKIPFSWCSASIIILFLPHLFQRYLMRLEGIYFLGGQPSTFSLTYAPKNLVAWLGFFLSPRFPYPTVPLLTVIAGAGLVALAYRYRRQITVEAKLIAFFFAAIALVHFTFSYGDIRIPWAHRYALIYLAPICLFAAYALKRAFHFRGGAFAALAALALIWNAYLPATTRYVGRPSSYTINDLNQLMPVITRYPRESTLIISDQPFLFAMFGISFVSYRYADQHGARIAGDLRTGALQHVLRIQREDELSRQTGNPVLNYQIGKNAVSLRELSEADFNEVKTFHVGRQ